MNINYFEYIKKMLGFVMSNLLNAILSELYIQSYELLNIINHNIYKQYIFHILLFYSKVLIDW